MMLAHSTSRYVFTKPQVCDLPGRDYNDTVNA